MHCSKVAENKRERINRGLFRNEIFLRGLHEINNQFPGATV